MTLEERIKAIENCTRIDDIDYEKDSVNIAANLVASVASQALSIIQELQTKNKELEAKLNYSVKEARIMDNTIIDLYNIADCMEAGVSYQNYQDKLKELNNDK